MKHALDTTPTLEPLVVMYHYIHVEPPPEPSGIHPLLASEFEAQLNYLQHHYDVCHPTDFLHRLRSPRNSGKPPCLLTFDDGTIDHATIATPILTRRNLAGLFFILSGPATEGYMPTTHLLHWALGQGDELVWQHLQEASHRASLPPIDLASATRIYHYEPPLRARIKYAVNIAWPQPVVRQSLLDLVHLAGLTPADLAHSWFISADDARQMHLAGMVLGVHGHTHRSLPAMDAEVTDEIARCTAFIRHTTGCPPHWFACPFGGSGATSEQLHTMHQAMSHHGLTAAVTTAARHVSPTDPPHALPRLDCVSLPPRRGTLKPPPRSIANIRQATPTDRDDILTFIATMGFHPRSVHTWDTLKMSAVIAVKDDQMMGAVPFEPRTLHLAPGVSVPVLHQTCVAVAPIWRSFGVGHNLQEWTRSLAHSLGCGLTVFREDPSSRAYRWYVDCGFKPVITLDSYFLDVLPTSITTAAPAELLPPEALPRLPEHPGTFSRSATQANFLAAHPYRGRYTLHTVITDSGYALLGVGKLHSTTDRADILALEGDPPALLPILIATSRHHGWTPLRWTLPRPHPHTAIAASLGMTARWSFDMLASNLDVTHTNDRTAHWTYRTLDFS